MTNILKFNSENFNQIKDTDSTNRNIGYSEFENAIITGRNSFYPNVLLLSDGYLFSPYDEKVMSLNQDTFYDNNIYKQNIRTIDQNNYINTDVFFFIYNFDNYYHFLYDTLPYLHIFQYLKSNISSLKILVNYPNSNKKDFYKFNTDILGKIVNMHDIIIHNNKNIYKKIYVASSLTHGGFSNISPNHEIYNIYECIKQNFNIKNVSDIYKNLNKIYISRRTWINNDTSNIGTNYTTRRKMMNEDELVEKIKEIGYVEIFTENMNIDEKIYVFSRVEYVCGSIGGGMANLLFSGKKTKTYVIVTPYFLNINYRFKFCMEHTEINYFNNVSTYTNTNKIPLFCRVMTNDNNNVGEIINYDEKNDMYLVQLSNNDVAGFNNLVQYNTKYFNKNQFKLLDNGLNSPYIVDISGLISMLQKS